MRKVIILLFISGVSFCQAFAFQEKVNISSIYRDVLNGQTEFYFENVEFVDDTDAVMDYEAPDSLQFISSLEELFEIDLLAEDFLSKHIEIFEISESTGDLMLYHLKIDDLIILESEFEYLDLTYNEIDEFEMEEVVVLDFFLDQCTIDGYYGMDNTITRADIDSNVFNDFFSEFQVRTDDYMIFEYNEFNNGAAIDIAEAHSNALVRFRANTFNSTLNKESEGIYEMLTEDLDDELSSEVDTFTLGLQLDIFTLGDLSRCVIWENEFLTDNEYAYVNVEANMNSLEISDNLFESNLIINGSVQNYWEMLENEFDKRISITDLNIRETGRLNVTLDSLMGKKLAVKQREFDAIDSLIQLEGEETTAQIEFFTSKIALKTEEDGLLETKEYNTLISDYYRVHSFYKENGFHEYSDYVYLRMKDVELKKLHAEWQYYGGLERLIKWQLNSILKFYTKYGTSPTRAIIISFYVMLAFTLFYFFFPSEWDTRSKAQLLIDFRDFKEKNDKGYIKPFFSLCYDLFKSFANAFSLSLNSFITLGFGAIPTTGIARYVCIFQGFLGWFLLSIFTASLISQILY